MRCDCKTDVYRVEVKDSMVAMFCHQNIQNVRFEFLRACGVFSVYFTFTDRLTLITDLYKSTMAPHYVFSTIEVRSFFSCTLGHHTGHEMFSF